MTDDEITAIAENVLLCARAWVPEARLMGNVKASELEALALHVLGRPPELKKNYPKSKPQPPSPRYFKDSEDKPCPPPPPEPPPAKILKDGKRIN